VPALIRFARRTRRIVLQNFAWAIGFNAVALTLGVLGRLHPIAAALAMLASSLLVLANSRRVGEFPRLPQEAAP
jgi:Cu2+-exporting ATPase